MHTIEKVGEGEEKDEGKRREFSDWERVVVEKLVVKSRIILPRERLLCK